MPCDGPFAKENLDAAFVAEQEAQGIFLLLNLLLVPRFGAVGAAAATSSGIIVENATCSVLAWRRVRINTTILPLDRGAAHA